MPRFLKILFGLILVLIIVAVVAPFFIPADTFKGEVLAQIEARTGRKVSIDHIAFTLFPTITLNAENVKISNPGWAGGGDMAEIKKLTFGLELIPLLHKEYRLKELILEEPVLVLVKQHGKANWDFSKPAAASEATSPAVAAKPVTSSDNTFAQLAALHLDEISIKNGQASYKDDASNKAERISSINFLLKAPDLSEKVDFSLSALFEGKKIETILTLKEPLAFERGKKTDIALKAVYGPFDFTYSGSATLLPGGIPSLSGKLTVPALDTSDLSPKGGAAKEEAHSTGAAKPVTAGASRWSDAPIRLEGLARLDADLALSIGKLTLPKTTLENIDANLQMHGGKLQLTINPINAYGGTVAMALGLTTAGALTVDFKATHAEAEPLLHDFASYDRVSGTIDAEARLAANGASERALIGSLSGSGNVHFRDGRLKGVNIPSLLRNITGAQGSDSDSTEFSELSGTYTVARGIVSTSDLKMSSPLLRMTGSGTADLPSWQEHFVLKPSLVASMQGQGGKDAAGITVPVDVDGPIDHPHYQPDLKAALQENLENLKDPAKLKQDVKSLLQGGGKNGGLGGLFR